MGQLSDLNLRSFAYRLVDGEGHDPTLDLDRLVAPFEGDRPAGEMLLYEGTYDRIRDARSEDDTSLPQGIWETAVKVGDWRTVRKECVTALETQSKDLQIALWLTEALARLHGFGGFAQGLALVERLCAALWPWLHPELDDGDADARLNAFSWLNESLSRTLYRLPLALPDESPALSYSDVKAALPERVAVSDLPRERGRMVPNGLHITTAFSETPVEHLQAVHRATVQALEALSRLEQVLAEQLPRDELPGFGKIITILDDCRDRTARQLVQRGLDPEQTAAQIDDAPQVPTGGGAEDGETEEAEAMGETTGPTGGAGEAALSGPIQSRADAYRALADAADFLARTEPHSPVPYLVRRAIRWGNLPLADLLNELLEDGNDRAKIQELLGMGGQ